MSEEIGILYCANHPKTETTLRCNRCEKPICTKCAVRTPTGYRCRECVRGQQKAFETAQWFDYPAAFILAAVLSYLGSMLVPRFGFFTLFLAPIAGVIVAEAVRMVLRRRRGKRLFQLAATGAILGSLPLLLSMLINTFFGAGFYGLFSLIWQGLYTLTIASTVYYRLAGIRL